MTLFFIEEIQEAELDMPKIMEKVCRADERLAKKLFSCDLNIEVNGENKKSA